MQEFIDVPTLFNPYCDQYDHVQAFQYFRAHPNEIGEWRRRYVPAHVTNYCNECLILRQECSDGRPCGVCRQNNLMCTRTAIGPPIFNPEFDFYGRLPGQPIDTTKFPSPPPSKWPPLYTPPAPPPAPSTGFFAGHGGGAVAGPSSAGGAGGGGGGGGTPSPPLSAGGDPRVALGLGNQPIHSIAELNDALLRARQWTLPAAEGAPIAEAPEGQGQGQGQGQDSQGSGSHAGQSSPPPGEDPQGSGSGSGKGRGGKRTGRPLGKAPKCETCARRCRGRHKCNMDPARIPDPQGCTVCTQWGLFCVYEGVPLPPRPLVGNEEESAVGRCDPCMYNLRECDRKRPCDSCIIHGEEYCSGRNQANCFWRGAPGDNLPLYYEKLLFDGQQGVRARIPPPKPDMPPDYHRQYQPPPPGVDPATLPFPGQPGPAPHQPFYPPNPLPMAPIPAPVMHVPDNLFENLQGPFNPATAAPYVEMWAKVVDVVRTGHQIIAAENIRRRLAFDATIGVAYGYSALGGQVKQFILDRWRVANQRHVGQVPVNLPPDAVANPAAVDQLSPGNPPIRNVAAEPICRPPSPTPPQPTHGGTDGDAMINRVVNVFYPEFPPGHPSRPDMAKAVRPLPPHPATHNVLANIPYQRIWNNGRLTEEDSMFCMVQRDGHDCGRPAAACCEDTTHPHASFPICDTCEMESRNRFYPLVDGSARNLRAFCCAVCCHDILSRPELLHHSGLRVWGLSPGYGNADVDPSITSDKAPWHSIGGFMGQLRVFTGCSCGLKLQGRYLCSPHRLQHLINLRQQADSIDGYALKLFGSTTVCPSCHINPSIQAFNFQGVGGGKGQDGNPDLAVIWQCKGCHDIVVAPPGTSLEAIPDGNDLIYSNQELPRFSILCGGGPMPIANSPSGSFSSSFSGQSGGSGGSGGNGGSGSSGSSGGSDGSGSSGGGGGGGQIVMAPGSLPVMDPALYGEALFQGLANPPIGDPNAPFASPPSQHSGDPNSPSGASQHSGGPNSPLIDPSLFGEAAGQGSPTWGSSPSAASQHSGGPNSPPGAGPSQGNSPNVDPALFGDVPGLSSPSWDSSSSGGPNSPQGAAPNQGNAPGNNANEGAWWSRMSQ